MTTLRSTLIIFVDGLEKARASWTMAELDQVVTSLVMDASMTNLEQGRLRMVVCNTDVSQEDIATWIYINSKQAGGLKEGNRHDLRHRLEEIDLVEIKKNVDLNWQIAQQKKARKKLEIKKNVHQMYAEMGASERKELKEVFTGDDDAK